MFTRIDKRITNERIYYENNYITQTLVLWQNI